MKSLFSFLFLSVVVLLTQAQWVQVGNDLDGEAPGDKSGTSLSLSGDGQILAVGAQQNDGQGSNAGHVRIYTWNNNMWSQLGSDIDGDAMSDLLGSAVALSHDGQIVAIGASGDNANTGQVRVFKWNGTNWIQQGQDINGEAIGDKSGRAIALSSNGEVLAIGATSNDGSANNAGHARVYWWTGALWLKRGQDLDGEAEDDQFGGAISLSADGNTLAVGADENDGNGTAAGHVRVFTWDGSAWQQKGADIDGETIIGRSGSSISLSANGQTIAIGAPMNDDSGTSAGHTRVFRWNGTNWVQKGVDIDGENTNDRLGTSVSLSGDGQILAIGATQHDGNGSNAGQTKVYAWIDSAWQQRGASILGETSGDYSGIVSLSNDGSLLGIGAFNNDGNGSDAGHVRVFRYFEEFNSISGKVFWDGNHNLTLDSSEVGFLLGNILSAGDQIHHVNFNSSGNYTIYCDTGYYAAHFKTYNNNYFNVSAVPHSVYFDTLNSRDTFNIPVHHIPGSPDLQLHMVPLGAARPGSIARYRLIALNVGTDTLDGMVVFFHDDSVTLHTTSPLYHTYQGDSLIWNFTEFAPLEERHYDIEFLVWNTLNLGSEISFSGLIQPIVNDQFPQDNFTNLRQTVIGSYDPNDKWVNLQSLTNSHLEDSIFLTYRVRFQNTGTDTAFNVVIADTLDNNLDWSSIQMLHASHPWEMSISEQQNIAWSFPNILLPDSNVNEPASHGFIVYRIRPKSSLQPGATIQNKSSIYFDFNEPIVTNTTQTRIFWGATIELNESEICVGDTIKLHIKHYGLIDSLNTTFIILSDPLGAFNMADTINQVRSDSTITWIVQELIGSGSYFLRAVTSVPQTNGSASEQNLDIQNFPNSLTQPDSSIEVCFGVGASISVVEQHGSSYMWFGQDSLLSSETSPSLIISTIGTYSVVVSNRCGTDTSDQVTVTVHPLPLVTFDTSYTLCHDQSSFTLSGGEPLGGDYSGTGVSSNSFSATTAGIGTHNISYVYIDNNGCSDTAWTQIEVEVCGSSPTFSFEPSTLNLYPNPADEVIRLEWKGSDEAEVRVWSTSGILVTQQLIIAHSKLHIESWSSGVYLVEVKNDDRVWRNKVVVE